jgi:glycosyltransferase involved in cell wall biosynthesis
MDDAATPLNNIRPAPTPRTGWQPPAISPRHLGVLINHADAARDRRDWHEAARLYELVSQASPSSHGFRVQLGHAYKELGDFERAGLNYQTVLRLTPGDDDLHVQIGHLEKLKGNLSEAATCYAKAAELNPTNTDALVEYYALAPKLGLPPLPFHPDQDDQTRNKELQHSGQVSSAAIARTTSTADSKFEPDGPSHAGTWSEAAKVDRRRVKGDRRPKVLFVSDSLGTPIHPRGIFHYSTALVEILSDMGLEITLVVERSPEYGLKRRTLRDTSKLSPQSLDCYQLAEIYRYFNGDVFSFKWKYDNWVYRQIIATSSLASRLVQRVYDLIARNSSLVNNLFDKIQVTPSRGHHLKKFDQFLYIDRFYSDSMSRAVNDLEPVQLNAAGYDLVIIDTPHYVRVRKIDRSRIFTVIHDLIPLNDPFMGGDWRRLFLGKLKASLGTDGNLIFVSEYTRSLFHNLFRGHQPQHEIVLYPSIAKDWVEQSTSAEPGGSSAYIAAISRNRARERRAHIREMAARVTTDPETREEFIVELGADLPSWNGSLPYFATITSDEPRKNIAIFANIAKRFIGKANFIIIGQVDGNRYMNQEPELYPNLHFTGYLDDLRKADVMRYAAGVIFPSFAEGFGIPIVEGALFGVPVICSNIAVFHEVTRNLAAYFDPHSADELAAQVDDLLANRAAYVGTALRLRQFVLSRFSQQVMQQRLQQAISEIGIEMQSTNMPIS